VGHQFERGKMISKVFALLITAAMLFNTQGVAQQKSQSLNQIEFNTLDLVPDWTTGPISGIGQSQYRTNVIVSDINQDGVTDITYCARNYPVTVNYQGSGNYDVAEYGEDTNCSNIKAGDRDNNGVSELYIVTTSKMVLIYDYDGSK
jgi:hypothetical protein